MGSGTPGGVLDQGKQMRAKVLLCFVNACVRARLMDGSSEKGCRPSILAKTCLRPHCAARAGTAQGLRKDDHRRRGCVCATRTLPLDVSCAPSRASPARPRVPTPEFRFWHHAGHDVMIAAVDPYPRRTETDACDC